MFIPTTDVSKFMDEKTQSSAVERAKGPQT